MARPLANSEALSAIARRMAASPSIASMGAPAGARYCWPSSRQSTREASSSSCRMRARRPGVNSLVAFNDAVHCVSSASAWPGSLSGRRPMSFFASSSVCIGWSGSGARANARSLNLARSKATLTPPWPDSARVARAALARGFHHVREHVNQLDAGIDLIPVDRDALDVDAERDVARVRMVEDAPQVVAADLDRLSQRRCA